MIAGLGNPGPAYANTRHNVGFMVVDEVARRLGVESWKTKDRARQALVRSRDLLLVEPQSFMNESGVPVRLVATWYRVPSNDMLVVYDDMDMPFGKLRLRERGSSGGHNGIRSIISYFGQDFPRLKVGIGRGHDGDAVGRVLGAFSPAERADLEKVIAAGADACLLWLDRGFTAAANVANAWLLHPPEPMPPAQTADEGNKPGND